MEVSCKSTQDLGSHKIQLQSWWQEAACTGLLSSLELRRTLKLHQEEPMSSLGILDLTLCIWKFNTWYFKWGWAFSWPSSTFRRLPGSAGFLLCVQQMNLSNYLAAKVRRWKDCTEKVNVVFPASPGKTYFPIYIPQHNRFFVLFVFFLFVEH